MPPKSSDLVSVFNFIFFFLTRCPRFRSLSHLRAPLVESELRFYMRLESRVASLGPAASNQHDILSIDFFPNSLLFGSYVHLARSFAHRGSAAQQIRRKLKLLRLKRGGLYDTSAWTLRFSKAVKMWASHDISAFSSALTHPC